MEDYQQLLSRKKIVNHNSDRRPVKVAILADSRGAGLKFELDHLNDGSYDLVVIVKKGRGVVDLVRETSKRLVWIAPDITIVLAGICDIMEKDRETRLVSLQNDTAESTIEQIKSSMDIVRHHLSIVLTENPHRLIFGHIVGMDMARYNVQNTTHPQQSLLNEIVTEANQVITAFNSENDVPTAWMAKEIHPNNCKRGNKKKYHYQKLASDGLHLTDHLRERWAKTLMNLLTKICG